MTKQPRRQAKTPRQRAQEQLDVANRHVQRLTKRKVELQTALDDVTREHDAACVRRDYLKKHPDLATPGDTATIGAGIKAAAAATSARTSTGDKQ